MTEVYVYGIVTFYLKISKEQKILIASVPCMVMKLEYGNLVLSYKVGEIQAFHYNYCSYYLNHVPVSSLEGPSLPHNDKMIECLFVYSQPSI